MNSGIVLRLSFLPEPILAVWVAALRVLLIVGMIHVPSASAQSNGASAGPPLQFEVASIRPALPLDPSQLGPAMLCLTPCAPGERLTVTGSRVDIRRFSIYKLIVTAYRLKMYSGLSNPDAVSRTYRDWMQAQRFDISAKIPEGVSKDLLPEMLQTLLADRFKLSLHRETREVPVLALLVGKNGPKLKAPAGDADAPVADTPTSQRVYTPNGEARFDGGSFAIATGPQGPIRFYTDRNQVVHTDFLKITMAELVEVLLIPGRPIIDLTNLKGSYQFSYEHRRVQSPDEPSVDPSTAVREALDKVGLRLEPRTAPVEVIVIDHLEKSPTEN